MNGAANWTRRPLADVAELITGPFGSALKKRDYVGGGIPVINPMHIDGGCIVPSPTMTVSSRTASRLEAFRLRVGDVIIGRRGEMGRCAVVTEANDGWLCGTGSLVVRPHSILYAPYLQRFLSSPTVIGLLEGASVGSTMVNLNQRIMRNLEVPVPPLAEQKRIADKLDRLLAAVHACKARLDAIPTILKRVRQSVLASATSGKLTEEWRSQSSRGRASDLLAEILSARRNAISAGSLTRDFFQRALSPDRVEGLPELPLSWTYALLDQLVAPTRYALKAGPFGSALKKDSYANSGYKVYGQEQVIRGDESFGDYFIAQDKFDELQTCAVMSGDILVSLVGTIGKVLVLSPRSEPGIINPRLLKLSLHPKVSREYLRIFLSSPGCHSFYSSASHGGTMEILNLEILRHLPIPMPPVEEQAEIATRVEGLLRGLDDVILRLNHVRRIADKLESSLLTMAFQGNLICRHGMLAPLKSGATGDRRVLSP